MNLTKQNIEEINKSLIKNHVDYIDIRIEILDHFASELEKMEGNFDTEFPILFQKNKNLVKQMMIGKQKVELRNGFKKLIGNIFSKRFFVFYIIVALTIFSMCKINGIDWFLSNFDMLPIIIPAPITAILMYNIFFSKKKSTDMIGLLSVTNLIFMSYLYLFVHIVRKSEICIQLPVFSFFTTLSLMYYIFYFESKKMHKSKYTSLWN